MRLGDRPRVRKRKRHAASAEAPKSTCPFFLAANHCGKSRRLTQLGQPPDSDANDAPPAFLQLLSADKRLNFGSTFAKVVGDLVQQLR